MSLLSIDELHERSGEINEKWERTYTRTFRVIMSETADGPSQAILAVTTGFDIRLQVPYEAGNDADFLAFCKRIRAESVQSDGVEYKVTVEYGPFDLVRDVENPLDAPPEVSWTFAQFERPVDQDVNGNPIVNTAGDPFDPPLMRDDSRPVLEIVRNEPSFDPNLAKGYKDRVNTDVFFDQAPGTVKVANITGRRKYNQNIGLYYEVKYEFAFQDEGWSSNVLNAGLRQIDNSTNPPGRSPILIKGVPATEPIPLDNNGEPLGPDDEPVFLNFMTYNQVPFAELGF